MKILEKRKWGMEVVCHFCQSRLLVEAEDIRAGADYFFARCQECNGIIKLPKNDIPTILQQQAVNTQPTKPKSPGEPRFLKPAEAAQIAGISKPFVYQLIAKGLLPSAKIGDAVRIPAAEFYQWLDQKIVDSKSRAS